MTEALVLAAIIVLIAAALAVGWRSWARGWLWHRRRRKVRVHTMDRLTIEGILLEVSADGLVLVEADDLDHGADLKGDVFIPRANVWIVQVLLEED